MDRLKELMCSEKQKQQKNLHSSMDRLKVENFGRKIFRKDIYIPVWID